MDPYPPTVGTQDTPTPLIKGPTTSPIQGIIDPHMKKRHPLQFMSICLLPDLGRKIFRANLGRSNNT